MARPIKSKEQHFRAYELFKGSIGAGAISLVLDSEFKESVALRTVERWVHGFKMIPSEDASEDIPFAWSKMTGIPWQDSRTVLTVWAYYNSQGYDTTIGPFTRRQAKWCWRVVNAFGESTQEVPTTLRTIESHDIEEVFRFGNEYVWREFASVLLDEPFDTSDLDMVLAFTPWKSLEHLEIYRETKYRPDKDDDNQPEPVRWHYLNLDWLEKVAPSAAKTWKVNSPDTPIRQKSEVYDDLVRYWNVAIDGLLPIQFQQWRKARFPDDGNSSPAGDATSEPWYFDVLDESLRNLKRD